MEAFHLDETTQQRLRESRLDKEELMIVLRHLSVCEVCAVRAASSFTTTAAALHDAIAFEDWHLEPDDLIATIDGSANAEMREAVTSHLDRCPLCRTEAEDLGRWRRKQRRDRTRLWAVAAAVTLVFAGALAVWRSAPEPRTNDSAAPPVIQAERPRPVPAPSRRGEETARYARPEWAELVSAAVTAGRLPVPSSLAELRPVTVALRGSEDAAVELSPSGTVIEETEPQFSWPPTPGATYVVVIARDEQELAVSTSLPSARWRVDRPLPRGVALTWQVEVSSDGMTRYLPEPPQPLPTFAILTAAASEELRAARTAHPADHLLHAVLYARYGVVGKAREALRRALDAGDPRARSIPAPE